MMQNGRRRLVCHHEAGHVLARWYFGHRTDRAVVLTVSEVRAGNRLIDQRGRPTDCEGLVEGYNISDHLAAATYEVLPTAIDPVRAEGMRRHMRCNRDIMLVMLAAGIAAEAAYRHSSPAVCGLEGGSRDFGHLRVIGEAWFPDKRERDAAYLLADVRATALVRSRFGAAAIKTMADALMEHGEIDGDAINRLCSAAYGGRTPRYGSWVPHWPPSLKSIRAGVIRGEAPARAHSCGSPAAEAVC